MFYWLLAPHYSISSAPFFMDNMSIKISQNITLKDSVKTCTDRVSIWNMLRIKIGRWQQNVFIKWRHRHLWSMGHVPRTQRRHKNGEVGLWREGSVVKRTCFPRRRPGLSSQPSFGWRINTCPSPLRWSHILFCSPQSQSCMWCTHMHTRTCTQKQINLHFKTWHVDSRN